ncbi:hypothetical protein U471_17990 [Bacillus amyloliquefaciens CC178]|nr:hypothetical protein U471_17990 [Bacillus amyloliquefaciens CC178]
MNKFQFPYNHGVQPSHFSPPALCKKAFMLFYSAVLQIGIRSK